MFNPSVRRRSRTRPARDKRFQTRPPVAEPLEERVLMALAKAGGGSGYSGTLSTSPALRQQQLICDPDEPVAGSTSVRYDSKLVTLTAFNYGPGYGPLVVNDRPVEGFVATVVGEETVLQPIREYIREPKGEETGYVQVMYQLNGEPGQVRPPDGFEIVDEDGVEGVDTHWLGFALRQGVSVNADVDYTVFAAEKIPEVGNEEDFLMTKEGLRLRPAELSPAHVSTVGGGAGPQVLVGDALAREGDSGTSVLGFAVLLTEPVTTVVTVDFATADGTATSADNDYRRDAGTIKFEPGETSVVVPIAVIGDLKPEENETLVLDLSNALGATINRGRGVGTILDDDRNRPTPTLSVFDAAVVEGDGGAVNAVFHFRLSGPSASPAGIAYRTADHTATAPGDYAATINTVVFAPGETDKSVSVPVAGDVLDEPDETFFLDLFDPMNLIVPDVRAVGTIVEDDDRPPTVDVVDVTPDPRTDPVDSVTIRFSERVAGFDLADVSLTRDGAAVPLGSGQQLSSTDGGTTWILIGLRPPTGEPGVYVLTVAGGGSGIIDAGGNALAAGASDTWQVVRPGTPPVVTQVFVGSTRWTAEFKDFLRARRLGDATFGYAVPDGRAQLDVLPWGNLDQVSVRFDRPVLVIDADLAVRGTSIPDYPVSDIDYDEATSTATFTLARFVRNDRLVLTLNAGPGGVIDVERGVPLDGEWADGSDAYPSGDGAAGGDLRLGLNVLAGDANRDGKVNGTDWYELLRRRLRTAAKPGTGTLQYTAFHDLNGDAALGTPDQLILRGNYLATLPPAASASAARLARLSITRDLLGAGGSVS